MATKSPARRRPANKASTSKASTPRIDVYADVTAKLVAKIEDDINNGIKLAPWQRFWDTSANQPRSLSTGKLYRSINPLLLSISAELAGYTSQWWGTFPQIAERCGATRGIQSDGKPGWINPDGSTWTGLVGQKATFITLYKRYPRKGTDPVTGEEKEVWGGFWKYYAVFNTDQVTGEIRLPVTKPVERVFTPNEEADRICLDWSSKIKDVVHKGTQPRYTPATDTITMPVRSSFHGQHAAEEYACSFFHESVHSTGHPTRENREGIAQIDSRDVPKYGREELIAEMGAAMLCGIVGIHNTINNSASYLKGWLDSIKGDPRLLIQAAGQAQRACDMILGVSWDNEGES